MTLTLEDFRRIRDQRESAERAEREQVLREKLFPLLILDIRGKLSEADGLSLVELLQDLEMSDGDYSQIKSAATTAVANYHQAELFSKDRIPERIRLARMALARRHSERTLDIANAEMKLANRTSQISGDCLKAIESTKEFYPYLFVDGSLDSELVKSVPKPKAKPVPASKHCPICDTDFNVASDDQFCSSQCRHVSQIHAPALIELGVLPSRKNGTKCKSH